MITLSRFGITVTPDSVGADVKLNPDPEGKLAGGAVTGGAGWVGVEGVPLDVVSGGVVVVDVGGSEGAAAVGEDEDPLPPPPQLARSAREAAAMTWGRPIGLERRLSIWR